MKWLAIVLRTLLGLVFVVFGLNMFLNFIPIPSMEQFPALVKNYMAVMVESKYLHVVKVLEIMGGLMLLTGRFVPLGLTILTPIIVNILLYEILLMGSPGLAVVLLLFAVILIWLYRSHFLPVFAMNAKIGA